MKRMLKVVNCDLKINDFEENAVCLDCIKKHSQKAYENIECAIKEVPCRVGYLKNEQYELFVCSDDSKTTDNFKKEFALFREMIPYLPSLVKDLSKSIENEYENRFQKFIHNIRTNNARCIQVIESLGFNKLNKEVKLAIKRAREIIIGNTDKTARSLFDIMKFESMIKVEITVFEQMYKSQTQTLEKDFHSVRDIIMLTLHRFFYDFNQKDVYVNVEDNYDKVYLNYESFSCSLYYVIENATKYVKPESEMEIKFLENTYEYCIFINMESHYLSEKDRQHIFDEGYSGEIAKENHQNGHGLGMFRARKLLSTYGIKIDFDCGNHKELYDDIFYANNTIKITIPISPDKPIRKNKW